MKRTTLVLPDDLKRRAQERARREGISFSELVRGALARELGGEPDAEDSFLKDDAVYRGEVPEDLSADHDRYLYDDPT